MAKEDRDARSYEYLARRGYALSPREIGSTLGRLARRDPTRMSFSDKFALHYYSKQWGRVGDMLRQMPEDDAAAVYSKILKDLTTRERPAMLMDDVLGLIDAAPGELSGTWIRQLGVLVKVVIIPEEQWMLGDKLDKGTRLIGGRDPARRLVAGRILMQTPFSEIAVRFLPTVEEARQLEDEAVRAEVLKYLEAKKQADRVRDAELSQTLSREFAALLDSSASAQKRQQQVGRLAWKLDEVTPDMLIAVVKRLLADDKELAASFMLSACDKMGHTARHQHKGELRTRNARFLAALGDLVSREVDTKDPIWSSVLTTMADIWLQEAETTLSRRPEYEKRKGDGRERSFARPQELVAVAPRGRWRAVLPAGYGERIDLVLPRLVMMCADPDQAIPQIVEINKRNPKGAALLAQDFVRRWAELHNPEIPEAVRQRYKLPRGSAIVVTPLMIEKNIQGLARIMRLLSESKILPDDYARIVDAFDRCYGNAEVYRVGHIEKVFGAVESMDAKLFGALTGKMADGLGKRWRQMTVQESALTTRGQQEVLLMVRSGYGDLLKMIDTRVAAHPADWRALSVGGTVLSDWGDYEYFQELAKASDHDRMFRYKEKNNLAQGYFKRAAQAYVKEASAKKRPPVVLGPFLAWFNSILGLNSNGEINLSKAMNRRALTQMRDLMRGLPGKTAQAHVDAFAEYVDTRMESKRSPLPAELKYKFLASGLVITADSPFASDARKQVEYFEDLLREVRLETRVDGPNTIWRQEDFGIIISLVHTDAMGRMINLEKYLKLKAPSKRVSGQTIRKMSSVKSARNEFEKNIIESLTRFFQIKSILFSAPDQVDPVQRQGRPAATGWEAGLERDRARLCPGTGQGDQRGPHPARRAESAVLRPERPGHHPGDVGRDDDPDDREEDDETSGFQRADHTDAGHAAVIRQRPTGAECRRFRQRFDAGAGGPGGPARPEAGPARQTDRAGRGCVDQEPAQLERQGAGDIGPAVVHRPGQHLCPRSRRTGRGPVPDRAGRTDRREERDVQGRGAGRGEGGRSAHRPAGGGGGRRYGGGRHRAAARELRVVGRPRCPRPGGGRCGRVPDLPEGESRRAARPGRRRLPHARAGRCLRGPAAAAVPGRQ
jgi:hypothetical protein